MSNRHEKALLREQQRMQQREEDLAALETVSETMRKEGASQRSIHTALTGTYEIQKSHNNHYGGSADHPPFFSSITAPGMLLSQATPQPLTWLWKERIPLGRITLLEGESGIGASLFALHLAACVSSGQPLPDGASCTQGNIILISPHDRASTTIKPRLEAAGGDPSHILMLNIVECLDTKKVTVTDRFFRVSEDQHLLEEAIQRFQASLVIIDTLDTSRPHDLCSGLPFLALLAANTNCAMLLIRPIKRQPHMSSISNTTPPDLLSLVHSCLLLTPDPDNEEQCLLVTTKHSLSAQPGTLAYHITANDQHIPIIQWLGKTQHPASWPRPVPFSRVRQHIIQVLNASDEPLGPQDIATQTGQDYALIRRTLRRMYENRELESPARGLYTTLNHPPTADELLLEAAIGPRLSIYKKYSADDEEENSSNDQEP